MAMLAAPMSQAAGSSSNISAKQLQQMILPLTQQIETFHGGERAAKESMGKQQLEQEKLQQKLEQSEAEKRGLKWQLEEQPFPPRQAHTASHRGRSRKAPGLVDSSRGARARLQQVESRLRERMEQVAAEEGLLDQAQHKKEEGTRGAGLHTGESAVPQQAAREPTSIGQRSSAKASADFGLLCDCSSKQAAHTTSQENSTSRSGSCGPIFSSSCHFSPLFSASLCSSFR